MTMRSKRWAQWLSRNWFLPLAVVLFTLAWTISAQGALKYERHAIAQFELALTVDVLLTLPVLYWLCYRRQQTRIAMAMRIVAVQCFGIYLATWIVPENARDILAYLEPLRVAGLIVLAAVEIRLMLAVVRLAFNPSTETRTLTDAGMPPFVAKLMLAEARFWRWVFSWLRR